ncbi:hypothetical protein [Candidatus Endolissoclinum faulkneri]|uniref:hypothetical protein n=1 Tax=Candidatus Endolissoclinum faulkneri TaxID=1263979 RepID=UPI00046CAC04|nr:hypothetical protein [Candidatus Endolissoclinum faulkneri]
MACLYIKRSDDISSVNKLLMPAILLIRINQETRNIAFEANESGAFCPSKAFQITKAFIIDNHIENMPAQGYRLEGYRLDRNEKHVIC